MNYLIIDDEIYARKALAKRILHIIDEEPCEIYEAEDVPTAKIILQKLHFDIIFLDICMPGENGLALVEDLVLSNLTYEIVIVTGHAEFEYARKALELGVRHYLLKPVNEDKLKEILLASIDAKKKNALSELAVLSEDIRHLVYGETSVELPFHDNNYLVIVVHGSREIGSGIYAELFNFFSQLFDGKTGSTVNVMRLMEFVAVCGTGCKSLNQLKEDLLKLRAIEEKYQETLYVGISSLYSSLEETSKAFTEAHMALNNRIMDRWNKVFLYSEERIRPLNESEFQSFGRALEKQDREAASTVLNRIIRTNIEENCHFAQLLYMYHKIANCLQEYQFAHRKDTDFILIRSINSFSSLKDIMNYFESILDSLLSSSPKIGQNTMQDILDYIQEYYYDFISLEALARDRYFMNAKYLGKLFRGYTGMSFSKYLNKVRMEKAAEYLEDGGYSIHQVSYMCGYNNVSHFIQTFKKYYNETPAKWKGIQTRT